MAEAATSHEPTLGAIITGEVLALMGRNRVSQTKLARSIGMSQPQLSERLNGSVAWRVPELEAIARYFTVGVASLLGPHANGDPVIRWSSDGAPLTCVNDVLGQMELAFVPERSLVLAST